MLKSIDLSLLDSDDPAAVDDLIKQVKTAIRDDGFLFLENYGISLEQVRDEEAAKYSSMGPTKVTAANHGSSLRSCTSQFALAQYLYNNISEEDKERLLFSPETGVWSGYKHPYGFKVRKMRTSDPWPTGDKPSGC